VQTLASHANGTRGAEGQFSIGINQCGWAVISFNEAAKTLLSLEKRLSATATPEKEGSFYYRHQWTNEIFKDVLAAYNAKPEFIVKHGKWEEYRLALGRKEFICRRGHAKGYISELQNNNLHKLSNCGSVFDATRLYLNSVYGDISSAAIHPMEQLRRSAKAIREEKNTDFISGLSKIQHSNLLASLESDIAKYEADPTYNDSIKISCDDWFLSKH
jgi:hypothetical protein